MIPDVEKINSVHVERGELHKHANILIYIAQFRPQRYNKVRILLTYQSFFLTRIVGSVGGQ